MEDTRDLFKKIRDTKGTFHAKTSSIKDRNGMDLTGQVMNSKVKVNDINTSFPILTTVFQK